MTCMDSPENCTGSNGAEITTEVVFLDRDTCLLGETEARRARGDVVDNVLALEEDVTENVEADALIGLDASEAGSGARGDGGVVDELSRHGLGDAADGDGEVGQSGRAGEYITALCVVDLGAGDLGVVGLCDGRVDVNQGCAGVDDAVDVGPDGCGGANRVTCRGEAPEALAVVNVDVSDGTGVLCGVDEAEVVGTGGMVLEVDSEELLGKRGLDGVEESLLRGGGDGVDGAEGKAKKTVGVSVLGELGRDGRSSLDGLGGGSHASDGDLISVDPTRRPGAVTIADPP